MRNHRSRLFVLGASTTGVACLAAALAWNVPPTDAQLINSVTLQGKVCPKGSADSGCFYCGGPPGTASPTGAGCDFGAVPVDTYTEVCDKSPTSQCTQETIACGIYRNCATAKQVGTCRVTFTVCY